MRTTGLAVLGATLGAALSGCGVRSDSLPATRNVGSLAATLTAVKPAGDSPTGSPPCPYQTEGATGAGVSWRQDAPRHGGHRARVVEVCLELADAGRPTDEWRLPGATVTGSRGRAIRNAIRQQQSAPGGRQFVWLEGPRAGRVWRVALDFCAADSYQGFSPDQLWTVRGLKLPGPDGVASVAGTSTQIASVVLDLVALVPPGRTTYRQGSVAEFESVPVAEGMSVSWPGHPQSMVGAASDASVAVVVGKQSPEQRLSIRAKDDRGRECREGAACEADGPHGNERLHVMSLDVPADARTLDLTFILQEARTVGSVVKRP